MIIELLLYRKVANVIKNISIKLGRTYASLTFIWKAFVELIINYCGSPGN